MSASGARTGRKVNIVSGVDQEATVMLPIPLVVLLASVTGMETKSLEFVIQKQDIVSVRITQLD